MLFECEAFAACSIPYLTHPPSPVVPGLRPRPTRKKAKIVNKRQHHLHPLTVLM